MDSVQQIYATNQTPLSQTFRASRCFLHPTLSLASELIWKDHMGPSVDLANWALRTSLKFTTRVKYHFHQGFWPDQTSQSPNKIISGTSRVLPVASLQRLKWRLLFQLPSTVINISAIKLNFWMHRAYFIIIRVFCPRAGPSLQTQAPRLQFCPKAGIPPKTQEPRLQIY